MRYRRLPVLLATLTIAALAAPLAFAKPATLTHIKVYRTPSGPDKGALTITGIARLTGKLPNTRTDRRARARLDIRLDNGRRAVTAFDTVRVNAGSQLGHPVRFDVRIPAARALRLEGAKHLALTATLSRSRASVTRAGMPVVRQPNGWLQIVSTCGSITLFSARQCAIPVTPIPLPPPAPPIGFMTAGSTNIMCVYFGGPNYTKPMIGMLWAQVALPDQNNSMFIEDAQQGQGTAAIDTSDGSFSMAGQIGLAWVGNTQNGITQTGLTITGAVPVSILSGPASTSTGPATFSYAPGNGVLPTDYSLTLNSWVVSTFTGDC